MTTTKVITLKVLLLMSIFLIAIGLLIPMTGITQKVPYTVKVRRTSTVTKTETIGALGEPRYLYGGVFLRWGPYEIKPNEYLSFSWSADGYLSAYILTEAQFKDFSLIGVPRGWLSTSSGPSGHIIARIPSRDLYYVVLYNPFLFTTVKVYDATVKRSWKETIVTWTTETKYRKVLDIPKISFSLLMIGLGTGLLFKTCHDIKGF